MPEKKLTPMCDCAEAAAIAQGLPIEELYKKQSQELKRELARASVKETDLSQLKLDPLEPNNHDFRPMYPTVLMKNEKCKYCGSYVFWSGENLPKNPEAPQKGWW